MKFKGLRLGLSVGRSFPFSRWWMHRHRNRNRRSRKIAKCIHIHFGLCLCSVKGTHVGRGSFLFICLFACHFIICAYLLFPQTVHLHAISMIWCFFLVTDIRAKNYNVPLYIHACLCMTLFSYNNASHGRCILDVMMSTTKWVVIKAA